MILLKYTIYFDCYSHVYVSSYTPVRIFVGKNESLIWLIWLKTILWLNKCTVNYLKKYHFLASNFTKGKKTRDYLHGRYKFRLTVRTFFCMTWKIKEFIIANLYFTFLWRISKSRLSVLILEGGIEPLNPNELNDEIIVIHKINQIISLKD